MNGVRSGFAALAGYCAGANDWRSAATAAAVWVALELGALSWRHRRGLEAAAWHRRYDRRGPTR